MCNNSSQTNHTKYYYTLDKLEKACTKNLQKKLQNNTNSKQDFYYQHAIVTGYSKQMIQKGTEVKDKHLW